MVTTAQLQTIAHFTYGALTHHVQSVTEDLAVERAQGEGGEGGDVVSRTHTFTVQSYLEGSSVANLKTQMDAIDTEVQASDKDFTLYRFGTKVREILAADTTIGPTATVNFHDPAPNTIQHFTFTVTATIGVDAGGGLLSHTYTDQTVSDDDEDIIRMVRAGTVTTEEGESAKDYIESNLPSQPAGYIREIQITTNDDDTRATYTVTDVETPYRNDVPGVVRTHTYTDTTITEGSTVTRKVRSGQVETITGTNASDWINANLPTLDTGFKRTKDVRLLDTNLEADYTISDEAVGGGVNLPPGVDEAQYNVETTIDDQNRKVIVASGYFIGSSAADEVDAIRAALENVVYERERINIYGDQRIEFTYHSLLAENDDDFLAWQESISIGGGGYRKQVRTFPGHEPKIFYGEQLPYVVTVVGRAEGLGQYVKPAPVIPALSGAIDSEPDVQLSRDHEKRFITTWRHRYVTNIWPGYVKPRTPIVEFLT